MALAFIEFVSNLLSFNLGWFISLVLNNLFWVFAYALLVHIIFNGEKMVAAFVLFALDVWLWDVFGLLSGVSIFGAQTLVIYYITKIGVLAIAEKSETLKSKFVVVSSIQGVCAILISNVI